ncbi:MAG: HK97 gp10 family phage protein [Clostridia bacterium]|nr:HK97 gp10 family phage protein [Clostridia bacterium]
MSDYRARLCLAILTALDETARVAAQMAADSAPVVTGRLRRSVSAVPAVWEGKGAAACVEARCPYAAYVELGTSIARPHPFLRPAALDAARRFRITL